MEKTNITKITGSPLNTVQSQHVRLCKNTYSLIVIPHSLFSSLQATVKITSKVDDKVY